MSNFPQRLKEDALASWASLRFRASDGAYAEGKLASIQVIPLIKGESRWCDLEVQITPYAIGEGVHPAIVEGAREAFHQALRDPNPGVRAAAEQALRALDEPRVQGEDLLGHALRLHWEDPLTTNPMEGRASPNGRGVHSCEPVIERTSLRGRVLFPNVPAQATCTLEFVPWATREEIPTRGCIAADMPASRAALSADDSVPPTPEEELLRKGIVASSRDGRVQVTIWLSPERELFVAAETRDEELAGARVGFAFVERSSGHVLYRGERELPHEKNAPNTFMNSQPLDPPFQVEDQGLLGWVPCDMVVEVVTPRR